MRYFAIEGSCNMNYKSAILTGDDITNKELDKMASDLAVEYFQENQNNLEETSIQNSWKEISREEYEEYVREWT